MTSENLCDLDHDLSDLSVRGEKHLAARMNGSTLKLLAATSYYVCTAPTVIIQPYSGAG